MSESEVDLGGYPEPPEYWTAEVQVYASVVFRGRTPIGVVVDGLVDKDFLHAVEAGGERAWRPELGCYDVEGRTVLDGTPDVGDPGADLVAGEIVFAAADLSDLPWEVDRPDPRREED